MVKTCYMSFCEKKKKKEREKGKTRGLITEQTYLMTRKLLKLDFSMNIRDNTRL